jgi:hypothetical protein
MLAFHIINLLRLKTETRECVCVLLDFSVLSCLGEDIICNGNSTPLQHERWVHFAADHITLYATLNSESVSNYFFSIHLLLSIWTKSKDSIVQDTCLLDIFYTKVSNFQSKFPQINVGSWRIECEILLITSVVQNCCMKLRCLVQIQNDCAQEMLALVT